MILEHVFPGFAANDESNVGFDYAIFVGQLLLRMGRIVCSYLAHDFLSQFGRMNFLSPWSSAPRCHVGMVLQCGSLDDMSRVYAGSHVAGVSGLRVRPVAVSEEKRQSMGHDLLPVIATGSISSFSRDSERPNQAFGGDVYGDGVFEPHPIRVRFVNLSGFFKGFDLGDGSDRLTVGHLRSFIAMVLSRVRFSERLGSFIIPSFEQLKAEVESLKASHPQSQ